MKQFIKKFPFLTETARKLLALKPASLKFGKSFWQWYGFFLETESWSDHQIKTYQFDSLKSLIHSVHQQIPYYRQLLTTDTVNNIIDIDSFQKLFPPMDRATFVKEFNNLCLEEKFRGKVSVCSSSGTTGTPLTFFHSREDDDREWAAICYQWKRVGYDPVTSKRAEFRGMVSGNRPVDLFPEKNMIRLNIFSINKQSVTDYAEIIKKYKIDFYHGFPSVLSLVADTVIRYNISFPQPHAILLASEQIHHFQLEKIKQAFPEAKLFAHYGCAERTVLAGWCEHSDWYHILPAYGIVETDPNTKEIIATNLTNTINPFIRYRMTDTVTNISSQPCPKCHRPFTPLFEQVAGRMEDYIYSEEHGWIAPAAVTYPLKQLTRISEMQFVQKEKRKLLFKYRPTHKNDPSILEREVEDVITGLKKMLGASIQIQTEEVNAFERTSSGKFRWIINELDESPMKQE